MVTEDELDDGMRMRRGRGAAGRAGCLSRFHERASLCPRSQHDDVSSEFLSLCLRLYLSIRGRGRGRNPSRVSPTESIRQSRLGPLLFSETVPPRRSSYVGLAVRSSSPLCARTVTMWERMREMIMCEVRGLPSRPPPPPPSLQLTRARESVSPLSSPLLLERLPPATDPRSWSWSWTVCGMKSVM